MRKRHCLSFHGYFSLFLTAGEKLSLALDVKGKNKPLADGKLLKFFSFKPFGCLSALLILIPVWVL